MAFIFGVLFFLMVITYGTVIVSFIRDRILDVVTGDRKRRVQVFLSKGRSHNRDLFVPLLEKRAWFKTKHSSYVEIHDRVLVNMLHEIAPSTNDKIFFLTEVGYETRFYNELDVTKDEVLVAVFPNNAILVLE